MNDSLSDTTSDIDSIDWVISLVNLLVSSDGVLEDMSLASRILEDNFYSPWALGLGLGLVGYVLGLGLVDKVLEFTKDTYTSSADALNVQQNCRTNSTNPMKYFGLLTMYHDNSFNLYLCLWF